MLWISASKASCIFAMILTAIFGSIASAQTFDTDAFRWTWDVAAVHRFDDLRWTIADGDGSPNILSELIWHDIWSAGAEGRIKAVRRRLLMESDFSLGFIYQGMNQDSDYLGNNRSGEFSRSNNRADGGILFRGSAGAGYLFPLDCTWFALTALAGLSLHGQNLIMTDGYQTISLDNNPPLGPFDGLNSSYRSRWIGPWVGAAIDFGPNSGFSARLRFLYHLTVYHAWANWNLRDDFAHPKSFEHMALGNGFDVRGSVGVGKTLQISVEAAYQFWFTGRGFDRTFFSSGTYSVIPLNGVRWKSFQLVGSIRYRIP